MFMLRDKSLGNWRKSPFIKTKHLGETLYIRVLNRVKKPRELTSSATVM